MPFLLRSRDRRSPALVVGPVLDVDAAVDDLVGYSTRQPKQDLRKQLRFQ